jgi:hypothetical protein
MNQLVRISKVNSIPNSPFRASTLYKWSHLKKYPGLFVKVGGALFVDLHVLNQIIERGRQ